MKSEASNYFNNAIFNNAFKSFKPILCTVYKIFSMCHNVIQNQFLFDIEDFDLLVHFVR